MYSLLHLLYSDFSPSFDQFFIVQVTRLSALSLAHPYLAGYSLSLVLVEQARHLHMGRKRKELKLWLPIEHMVSFYLSRVYLSTVENSMSFFIITCSLAVIFSSFISCKFFWKTIKSSHGSPCKTSSLDGNVYIHGIDIALLKIKLWA